MRRPARRLLLAVLCLALLAALTDTGRGFADRLLLAAGLPWSFTKSATVDRGTYFRLKVDVTYRGAPQHFDLVVGCNVLDIRYKDGSSTYEAGLVPTVYGRRMSDNRGLVVRPPDACGGETTANGRVPADFIPLMVVYENAGTLAFGTAYLSEDAYHSPLSLMQFGRATIEKATRAEFDAFRSKGEPNLVTREQYHSFQSDGILARMGLKRVWPAFARTCFARTRFRIPEAARPALAKFRPAGNPRFWSLPDAAREAAALGTFLRLPLARDDGGEGRDFTSYAPKEYLANNGVPKRSGEGGRFRRPAPSFYPVDTDLSQDKWPAPPTADTPLPVKNVTLRLSETHVEDGRYRGFAYCYIGPTFHWSVENMKYLAREAPLSLLVDGEKIADIQRAIDNTVAHAVFEEDKYFYNSYYIWIDSTRGDV